VIGHHHYSSRRIAVPKVFGLHEIEVPPGVTPEEHEQFLTKVLASAPVLPGWKTYLLKGERGERAGKLLLLHEIETVEARDRYFPGAGRGVGGVGTVCGTKSRSCRMGESSPRTSQPD
jgi:hypothetical protein